MATDTNKNITEAFAPPEPGGGGSTKTTWQALSPTKSGSSGGGVLSNGNMADLGERRSISLTREEARDYAQLDEGPILKCVLPPPKASPPLASGAVAKETPRSLGGEGRGVDNGAPQMTTWKSLSPSRSQSPPSSPHRSTPLLAGEGVAMNGSSKRSQSSSEGEGGGPPALMTWKDVSPTSSKAAPRPPLRKRRPESGYYSNECVQSQESREGMDTSLSGSESPRPAGMLPPHGPPSPEDGCFNADYFYDEDFSVQFDTNIREPSIDRDLASLPFPLTGSYARLGWQQDSGGVCGVRGTGDLYSGPYESELSGSRTSMEVSSSERDMMCSSDMLDLGSEPLFTPTDTFGCPHAVISVDSLMRENLNRPPPGELGSSRGSGDGRLTVDCCPRKEEYYLSFVGSRLTTSDNSYASQLSSAEEGGGEGSHSISSAGEDAMEECSDSFHFCHAHEGLRMGCRFDVDRAALYFRRRAQAARLALTNKLGALPERSIEKSQLSSEHSRSTRSNLSSPEKNMVSPGHSRSTRSGSSGSPNRSSSQNNLSPLLGALQACMEADEFAHSKLSPLLSALQACLDGDSSSSEDGNEADSRLPRGLTSWRHLKSMRRLGDKLRNSTEAVRSASLPDLNVEAYVRATRERCAARLRVLMEGVSSKRHAVSLTELYHRLCSSANPLSPDTLRAVESLLFIDGRESGEGWEDFSQKAHTLPVCSCRASRGHPPINLPLNIPPHPCGCAACEARRGGPCRRQARGTAVSPDTVTLWQGTKSVASQFPPNTAECAIQTSSHLGATPALDRSQQTSPREPEHDILALLREVGGHSSRKTHKEQDSPPRHASVTELRQTSAEKAGGPRRSLSLSPSRMGKNAFYSHRSLPDLSFLSTPRLAETLADVSLFDPVKIPIFLSPVVDTGRQASSPPPLTCRCGEEGRRRPRSLGSSGGLSSMGGCSGSAHRPHHPRRCASLAADLERLLFRPPHLESALSTASHGAELLASGRGECRRTHSEHSLSRRRCSHAHNDCRSVNQRGGHAHDHTGSAHRCPSPAHKHPGSSHSSAGSAHCGKDHAHSRSNQSHFTCGQTPPGSPEDGSDPGGGVCPDCGGMEGGGKGERRPVEHYTLETRPVSDAAPSSNSNSGGSNMPVNPKPKPRRLSASSSASNSNGDGEYAVLCEGGAEPDLTTWPPRASDIGGSLRALPVPPLGRSTESEGEGGEESGDSSEELARIYHRLTLDRRPLKSCLRKQPVVRSRSLSNPDSLHALQDGGSPPRKPNRYSIACDGLFPSLVNEDHFTDIDHDEVTQLAAVASALPPPRHGAIVEQTEAVCEGSGSSGSSVDESGHRSHRKSVSFATQVSFHSPQHAAQDGKEGEVRAETEKEQVEEAEIAVTMDEFISSDPELRHKIELLQAVVQGADALLEHFAQASNPFDKLRLGSSADCAEVGVLLLRMLCPAVALVMEDGLRPYLTAGLHVFGKIHITPWRVAEMSAELGPYTRAINELVRQLKIAPSLSTNRQRFYAFLTGLLNLRLLDFWLGFLRGKADVVEQVYEESALLRRSGTDLQQPFDRMLTSLQPLAALPFQLDYALVTSPSRSLSATPLAPCGEGPEGGGGLPTSRSAPTVARQPFLGEAKGRPVSSTRPSPNSRPVPDSPTGTGWSWLEGGALPRVVSTLTRSVGPARRLFNWEAKQGLRLLGVLSGSHPSPAHRTDRRDQAPLGDADAICSSSSSDLDGSVDDRAAGNRRPLRRCRGDVATHERKPFSAGKGRMRRTTSGEFCDLLSGTDASGEDGLAGLSETTADSQCEEKTKPRELFDNVPSVGDQELKAPSAPPRMSASSKLLPKPDLLPLDLTEDSSQRGGEKPDLPSRRVTSRRTSLSPITSFTSLASALLHREPQEPQAYRSGATQYDFAATATTSSAAVQNRGQGQGHPSLSRSGSFSLISFFDKLLLPSRTEAADSLRDASTTPPGSEVTLTSRSRSQHSSDGDCGAESEGSRDAGEWTDPGSLSSEMPCGQRNAANGCSSEDEDSLTLQHSGSDDSQADEGDEEEEEDNNQRYADGGSEFSAETSSSERAGTLSSSEASATTTTEEYNEKRICGTDTEELFDLTDSLDFTPYDLALGSSDADHFLPSPPPMSTFGKRLKGVGGVAHPRVMVCQDGWEDGTLSGDGEGEVTGSDAGGTTLMNSLQRGKFPQRDFLEARSPIDAAMPWACGRTEGGGENHTGSCLAECVRSPALSMSLDTEVDDLLDVETTTYANMDVLNANSPNTETLGVDGHLDFLAGGSGLAPKNSRRHSAWLTGGDRAGDHFSVPPYQYVVTRVPCDGDSDDSSCLSYEAGDYLSVLAQLDAQWLYCTSGHREGLVRISAVTPLHDPDVFSICHDDFYQ